MSSGQSKMPLTSESAAEFLFLLIVIWMIGGPVSGAVLSAQAWISSVVAKGATQVESTKNLAKQLLDASDRIKTLETKLAKAQIELTTLRQQSRDTNRLRALLGLKERRPRVSVASEVIARNPDNWFQQVVLDKGTLDGVVRGSAVITSEGVVGQVTSTSSHGSVVRLLTDPEQKLGVVFQRTGITGILSGAYQNPAKIDFVPIGTNIEVGDKIVCLGKGSIWPENHPVGSVAAVRREKSAASLQIEVKLSENCYDLSQVLVLPKLEN